MWRELQEHVKLIAGGLSHGESIRDVCPACATHNSSERTLSITKYDKILYNCYKARCGVRGVVDHRGSWDDVIARTSNDGRDDMVDVYHYQYEAREDKDISNRLRSVFRLEDMWDVKVDIRTGRVVFPNYSPLGEIRGVTLRRYGVGVGGVLGPKVIFVPADGYEKQERRPSWYYKGELDNKLPLFIVEDPVSAMRLAGQGKVNSAALMGVYLTPSGVGEVFNTYPPYDSGKIVVCLDNDATTEAARLMQVLREFYPHNQTTVIVPKDDPKDLNDDDLAALIGGVT